MTRDEENLAELRRRLETPNPDKDNDYQIGQLFGYFWKRGNFNQKHPELARKLFLRYKKGIIINE